MVQIWQRRLLSRKLQAQSADIMDFCGPAGAIYPDFQVSRANDYRIAWLEAAGYRIAGGTDEILKNTIAERVLGLPGDIRWTKIFLLRSSNNHLINEAI